MPFAVHNLHVPAIQIDHELSYAVVEDGPRFKVTPLDRDGGPAIFEDWDEAEGWRAGRVAALADQRNIDA
jgi:hypothetical protein